MDDNVVVEAPTLGNIPTVHKFAIFVIGGLATFGAQILVEKGYLKGLGAYRAAHLPELTE